MRRLSITWLAPFALASVASAISLKPETTAAFDRYVTLTERRMDDELARGQVFLWIDKLASPRRGELDRALRDGGVVIERLVTRDNSKTIDAPDALIHHWIGLVFVRGAKLPAAVALMQDYDRHAEVFAPNIAASKTLEQTGSHFRIGLRFHVKKVISVTMDTENEADFVRPSADRAYSRIRSTRVTEIADAGTPQERPKAPGQ